ncbi:MAG: ABC transporter permease [Eubacterium sp.]|nr:ABC transporter permease [Eubacterium sp.]
MNPLSSFYYIRNNKGRAALIIFMMFFTTLMFIAGNYIKSMDWYWQDCFSYEDRLAVIQVLPTDEDSRDYKAVREEIDKDPKLKWMNLSGYGYGGLEWTCTLGFDIGSYSKVFNSKEDMKTAFDLWGIDVDVSKLENRSIVISSALARNKGLKAGDKLDRTVDDALDDTYTLGAVFEGNSFATFYLVESENDARTYVYSDELTGQDLHDYILNLIGDRKVKLSNFSSEFVNRQLAPLYLIFTVGAFLLSVILAVTVNSVVNGQYIRRTYEFGVYRALGISRKRVFRKCAAELLLMDAIAILIGAAVCFLTTFLLNELYYIPGGRFLPYFSWLGVLCFVISNLTVLLPMILSKGRRMGKADVTEF